jgi:hypothetical protein
VLVNKGVGEDRWVITYRKSDGQTVGNVFTASGSAVFLPCTLSGAAEGKLTLTCGTSGGCGDTSYAHQFPPGSCAVSFCCSPPDCKAP